MEVQSAFAGAASAAAAALGMGDAFHIDDLLDFSNEDIAGPIGESFHLSSLDSTLTTAAAETANGISPGVSLTGSKHLLDVGPEDHPADVLCVPCDDLAELEWLSKFVEDSFSMGETPTRGCNDLSVSCEDMQFESSYNNSCKDRFQSASPVSVLESSASSGSNRVGSCTDNNAQTDDHHSNLLYRDLSSVPGRARSKRARTGGRVWGNSRILAASSASTTDTESLSSDSNVISGGAHQQSSSSALSADSSHQQHQQQQQQHSILLMMTPPPKAVTTVKKPWKPNFKSGSSTGGKKGGQHDGGAAATQTWRCLHCATQRTPQWRAGPMGPKTLCNACGVRFKSGRLLPEYRPAGSPGYVGHKHSNSHKKILEMRRQRETPSSSSPSQQQQHNQLSLSPASLLEDDSAGVCTSQN